MAFEQLKIQDLVSRMNTLREQGEQVTLRQYLAKHHADINRAEPDRAFETYLRGHGVDYDNWIVSQFFTVSTDTKLPYLFSELLVQALIKGMDDFNYVENLFAVKTTAPNAAAVIQPYIDYTGMKKMVKSDKAVSPGSEFDKDSLAVGDKRAYFKKFGKALDITYESIKLCKIKLLSAFLKGTAMVILADYFDYIVDVLINGDKAQDKDGNTITDTAAVIGVENTSNGVTFRDILRAAIRMSRKGRPTTDMLGDEAEMLDILNLDEYKKREQGAPQESLRLNGNITTPNNAYVADDVGTGKLLLLSKAFCLVRIMQQGLMVETQKIITKQIETAVVSVILSIMTLFRDSRIIIDGSQEFSSQGFPAWMAINKPK